MTFESLLRDAIRQKKKDCTISTLLEVMLSM